MPLLYALDQSKCAKLAVDRWVGIKAEYMQKVSQFFSISRGFYMYKCHFFKKKKKLYGVLAILSAIVLGEGGL